MLKLHDFCNRAAATDPEVAIVDDERVKAIFSELLRIGRHRDLTHIAPAASEHDSGPTPAFVGCVEPTPNSITFGLELYVEPLHHYPCPPSLDRKSTRLNYSHYCASRMPTSA